MVGRFAGGKGGFVRGLGFDKLHRRPVRAFQFPMACQQADKGAAALGMRGQQGEIIGAGIPDEFQQGQACRKRAYGVGIQHVQVHTAAQLALMFGERRGKNSTA